MVLGTAQLVVVLEIGKPLHAPMQHRLEYFGLEHPNFSLEWRTRTVVEDLAVFASATPGEARPGEVYPSRTAPFAVGRSSCRRENMRL